MDQQPISGSLTIQVPRQKNKPQRQATLAIWFAKVTLKRPDNIATSDLPEAIAVWAILAEEINPPDNV